MSQTLLCLIQISQNYLKQKDEGFFMNLFRVLKGQYGSNCFVLNSYFMGV